MIRSLAAFVIWSALPLALATVPAPAADALAKSLEAIVDAPEYQHASWGILVVDAGNGKTVYARNPDMLLAPASVTKLFTCSAALIAIGADATFETQVFRHGVVNDGTLKGDLILVAGGDLTLGGRTDKTGHLAFKDHDHTYANSGFGACEVTDTDPLAGLAALAKQVKAAGITRIEGEVIIDDRLFARAASSGSGPEAVTPIMVNDNVVDVIIEPGASPGLPAKVTTRPQSNYFQVDALVTTSKAGTAASVQLVPTGPTQFAVRGTVPMGKPVLRIAPINDPAHFARALFIEALRRQGVHASAPIARPSDAALPPKGWYSEAPLVASFTSPPFRETVKVTLKVSHNLYASSLPCLVAVNRGHRTVEAGLEQEGKLLRELGVDADSFSFGGGAGGSNADMVTPRAVVQLLQGMSKRPEWAAFKEALPIMGVDGTLAETVEADSPVRGKVFAKTGTLSNYDVANERPFMRSKALAGTMTTKKGTTLYFAMIVNNVTLPAGGSAVDQGKVLGRLCEILYTDGP